MAPPSARRHALFVNLALGQRLQMGFIAREDGSTLASISSHNRAVNGDGFLPEAKLFLGQVAWQLSGDQTPRSAGVG
jgi:hypothetical protein